MLERSLRGMDWMNDAACKGADPKLFFPNHKLDQGDPEGTNSYKLARAYCDDCSVIANCLRYAMKVFPDCNDDYGMWGGMSPRQRRKYKKENRAVLKVTT